MIPLQVFISGLILLLPVTGAVDSYTAVQGLVGQSVTLPCIYSTSLDGLVPACWGQGECRYSYCSRTLIWTNGYKITYQRSNRYQLKGNISEGNVSLTIENTDMSDGGPYCCTVEIPGAFYLVDYLLEVKPAFCLSSIFELCPLRPSVAVWMLTAGLMLLAENTTSPPTRPTTTGRPTTTRPTTAGRPTTTRPTTAGRPTTTRPKTTGKLTTISTRSTHVPTSTRVSTSTPPTPAYTQTHKPDWNNTVTSSDDSWNNNTEAIPPRKPQKNLTKGFYVGVSIAALLLLLLLSTVVITRYLVMKKKGSMSLVAFPVSKFGASQKKVVEQARGEDKIYIIEDTPNPEEES